MEPWMQRAGLGLCLGGALVVAVADALLSRALLVYLDAVEASVGKLAESVRDAEKRLDVTGTDRRLDRGQNRARALKVLGWLALILGFALQLAAACQAGAPA